MLNDDREKVDDSGNQINSFAYEYGNPLMRQMNKYPANQEEMTQLFDATAPHTWVQHGMINLTIYFWVMGQETYKVLKAINN